MRRLHMYLHDHIGWYRYWHHSPVRLPTHFVVALLALLVGGAVIFGTLNNENPQAAAGILANFPFQGRLTNSDGTVVANASYDAVFKLYSVSTGGTAVWTESHTSANQISTVDGIFNTMLGSLNSLSGIDFNQDEYWLGITVGVDAEMTPRIRLGAAPYAFNTDKLNGLSGTAFLQLGGQASGQIAFGGTAASENLVLRSTANAAKGNVIIADDGGNVGIGTATAPDFKLEVQGNFGPKTDDTYNLGSSALRWQDLYLGPTSLHLTTTVAETATARDWRLNVDETNGATDGDLRIQEGSNSYFGVTTAGNIVLGSAALATTATNGFLYTPSMAGIPTGVPTTYTGRVPLTYNTASNILYFYNGGWQPVSGGGGGITGSGAAGQVTIWSGTSAVTGDAGYLYDSTQKRLSVGTTPSTDTAAVLSIPNNKYISARNGTNSGNVALIGLNSSDYTQFATNNGAANQTVFDMFNPGADNNTYLYNSSGFKNNVNVEGYLGVYNSNAHATPIATSGHIRIPNDASITAKAAGAGDISLIKATTSDYIQIGPTSGGVDTVITTGSSIGVPSFAIMNPGTGTVNTLLEGQLTVYDANGFAATPASTGSIRLPNNASMNAKAVGAGDISLIKLNTTDQIQLGPTSGLDTYLATVSSTGNPNFILQNPSTGVANTQLEGALYVYNSDGFAATPASTGTIRLPNSASVSAKKVGAGDVSLISLAPSDQIAFGFTSSNTSAFDLNTGGETTFLFNNTNSGNRASVSVEGILSVYDSNSLTGAASTGVIRLPNNDSINARNAANTGDVGLIKLETSDQIAFGITSSNTTAFDFLAGSETTFLFNNTNVGNRASVGVEGVLTVYDNNSLTGAASTGVIRLPNNDSINARNAANTGDVGLIKLATSDQIAFGITSSNTTAFDFNAGSETTFLFNNTNSGNMAHMAIEGSLSVYNSNTMSGASTTGNIRLPNLGTITGRNQAGTGDLIIVKVNSSNQLETGSGVDVATGGDFYDTTVPASVSSTALCIAPLGQIGTCSSDERLKKNIADVTSGLSVVEQLSPKTYDFISGQNGQSGFLAQDVQKVLPGLVIKDTGDDYLSLNYNGILAYAVKAIQEMNGRIDVIDASKAGKADTLTLAALTTKSITVGENATIAGTLAVGQSVELASTLLVKDTATFEKDVAIGGNLTVTGSILGSAQTRGINVAVGENVTFLDVKDLALPIDATYAVSVTPSWRTGFWVTDKKPESFTIHFDTPAPKDALVDYLIQR